MIMTTWLWMVMLTLTLTLRCWSLIPDPVLRASLQQTTGGGGGGGTSDSNSNSTIITTWNVNPGPEIYPAMMECPRWIDFTSTTGHTAKFCGYASPEGVTDQIAQKGRFHHCNILPTMWKKATQDYNTNHNNNQQQPYIYLEIGANIGLCVMEMLLSTDAKIVAFELHPKNLWVLQATLHAWPQALQDRIVLVSVGLGATSQTQTIYAATGNMGNSVVGKIIKDSPRQEFDASNQFDIPIECLDAILSDTAQVALTKLDAQGLECQILEGLSSSSPHTHNLASRIHKIKFEVDKHHFNNQQCLDLLTRFRTLGYTLYWEDETTPVPTGEHHQF